MNKINKVLLLIIFLVFLTCIISSCSSKKEDMKYEDFAISSANSNLGNTSIPNNQSSTNISKIINSQDIDGSKKSAIVSSKNNVDSTISSQSSTSSSIAVAKLLFEDNFNGTSLDTTKWEYCPEWQRQGGGTWKNSMTSLDGKGNLVLKVQQDPNDNSKTISGAIRTFEKYYNSFGYYESSIKFPVVKGSWGAFWIMAGNVHNVDGSGKDGSEIDIMETIDSLKKYVNQNVGWDGYAEYSKSVHNSFNADIFDDKFHTFGLLWTFDEYVFFVDNKITWRTSANGNVCQEKGYMKLTIESAPWAGSTALDAMASLPKEMVVDYVRVYDKYPY